MSQPVIDPRIPSRILRLFEGEQIQSATLSDSGIVEVRMPGVTIRLTPGCPQATRRRMRELARAHPELLKQALPEKESSATRFK